MPLPITMTAELGQCGAMVTWAIPQATDNCEVTSFSADQVPDDFYSVGITTVNYVALDAAGNMAASSFTIQITDDEDPTLVDMPADISVNNDAGQCGAVVTWTAPTGTDNCNIASLTSDYDSGDTFPVGTTTVTYTLTDVNGNSIAESFDITVTDNENPTVLVQDLTLVLDASGAASTTATAVNNGSSDNCDIATLSLNKSSFNCADVGTNYVTLTVTDIHGNASTATATITVNDNQDPVIDQMADITATNDADNCSAIVTWTDPAVIENCTYTLTSDIASGTAFDVGVTTVTYTAEDAAGNSATMSFDVMVTDTQSPTISNMPGDITESADAGICGAVVTWDDPSVSDNCTTDALGDPAIIILTSSPASGSTFDLGTTTVTYTALDIYGNSSTASFTVTINNPDSDGDGICDNGDNCSDTNACNYAAADNEACDVPTGCDTCSDATGTGAVVENDADGDGTCDSVDGCPNDPAKIDPGLCGCGNVDNDVDNDGLCDDSDNCTDTNACNYSAFMELSSNVMAWHPAHISGGYHDDFLGVPASWAAYLPADGMFTVTLTHNGATADFQISHWTGANNGVIYLYAPADPSLGYQYDIFGSAFGEPVTIDDTVSITIENNAACDTPSGCDTCSDSAGSGTIVDNDADDDGTCDGDDGCPNDPAKTEPGICGCGNVDTDVDDDGVCDSSDACTDLTACNYDDPSNEPCATNDVCGECGGTGIPVGDCDCDGNQDDALGICGGSCAADADNDGICDDVDPCVGSLDACGVCNGPGAIYDCGCEGIPAGDCDCNGNQLDAIDECGGSCAADTDDDDICDDVDPCVGTEDVCGVCNGPGDVYECGCNEIPSGDCDCNGNQEDAIGVCGGTCAADADNDGICDDVDPCVGVVDACGICNGPGPTASCGCSPIPAGDCDCDGNQEDAIGVCGGSCMADIDGDGLCDDQDNCTDTNACNYDDPSNEPCATIDVCGVCGGTGIPTGNCDCDGNQDDALGVCGGSCAADADSDGICDDVDPCVGSVDACGICNGPGAIYDCGCEDIPAGDCDCSGNQLDAIDECGGSCVADTDDDGICDDSDACTDLSACNYIDLNNTPCAYLDECNVCGGAGIPTGDCDCDGNQLDALNICGGDCPSDIDNDGICDTSDLCTSLSACNYNDPSNEACATIDACGVCGGSGTDVDNDGVCDDNDLCTDPLANNYQSPGGEECESCPNAPIFDSIYYTTAAMTLSSADGAIALDISGNAASTLYLEGINGAPDYTIALPDDLNDLEAGYYIARVQDSDGCWGVADTSVGGTTLQQPAIQLEVIIPFTLCCSGCGINDIDADGICDDDDNCTDQTATNFADPANTECSQTAGED